MRLTLVSTVTVAALVVGGVANAAVVWNESTNGDLANSAMGTDLSVLAQGSKVLVGSLGQWPSPDSADYGTFTVASGQMLSKVVFGKYNWHRYYDYALFTLHGEDGEVTPKSVHECRRTPARSASAEAS